MSWRGLADEIWGEIFGRFLAPSMREECMLRGVCKDWARVCSSVCYTKHVDLHLTQHTIGQLATMEEQFPDEVVTGAFRRIAQHRGNLHLRTRLLGWEPSQSPGEQPSLNERTLSIVARILTAAHGLSGLSWHDVSLPSGVILAYLNTVVEEADDDREKEPDIVTLAALKDQWKKVWVLLQRALIRSSHSISHLSVRGKVFEISSNSTQGITSLFHSLELLRLRYVSAPPGLLLRLVLPSLECMHVLKSGDYATCVQVARQSCPRLICLSMHIDDVPGGGALEQSTSQLVELTPWSCGDEPFAVQIIRLRISQGDPTLKMLDRMRSPDLHTLSLWRAPVGGVASSFSVMNVAVQRLLRFLQKHRRTLRVLKIDMKSADPHLSRICRALGGPQLLLPELRVSRTSGPFFAQVLGPPEASPWLSDVRIDRWGLRNAQATAAVVFAKLGGLDRLERLSIAWSAGEMPVLSQLTSMRLFPGIMRDVPYLELKFAGLPVLRHFSCPFAAPFPFLESVANVAPSLRHISVGSLLCIPQPEESGEILDRDGEIPPPPRISFSTLRSSRRVEKYELVGFHSETHRRGQFLYSAAPTSRGSAERTNSPAWDLSGEDRPSNNRNATKDWWLRMETVV